MRRWILQGLLPALVPALVLVGVIAWGQYAHNRLRPEERYHPAFLSIECEAPPGLPREKFLGEVQYLADLPDQLDVLTGDAPEQLRQAFARHPWVEQVRKIEVLSGGVVKADLSYRIPALWVFVERAKLWRAVDRQGILLPSGPRTPGVARYVGTSAPPTGQPGKPWGDVRVEAAARLAGLLAPYHDRLCPKDDGLTIRLEGDDYTLGGGVVGRAVWGKAPGQESASEAPTETKLKRLLNHAARPAGASWQVDLRTRSAKSGLESSE